MTAAADNSQPAIDDHRAAASIEILPVLDLPEFDTDVDVAEALIACAPWLRDDDVVVVTSKVFSKTEGRMVAAPVDLDERDALRRKLIDDETVRVLARKNRTLITENRNGLVQAAAGVDGSNVPTDKLALLPVDPDASAAALRGRIAELSGHTVAVVVTDTMGRAWRTGQTDVAIGAAGIAVTHPYEGGVDSYGNPLMVTDIAVADEIAAAADLVKGKLAGVPIAVVRGLRPVDNSSTATDLVRPAQEDLFRLGTEEALTQGRREAILTRRSVRTFAADPVPPGDIEAACAQALTAPAPHHSHPVRFVWVRDARRRATLLDALRADWEADLTADDKTAESISKRLSRGDILYHAPELILAFRTRDGMHTYPDERRNAAEETMFTVAAGGAVATLLVALSTRGLGSCWVGSTIFAPATTRRELDIDESWEPLGAIAIGYPASPAGLREPAPTSEWLVQR